MNSFIKPLVYSLVVAMASTAAAQDLQVTEIWMGNQPGANLSEDWFEIVNVGQTPWVAGVDGTLYYDDESADPAAADPIAGISDIQPGETVLVLVTDAGTDAVDAFVDLWAAVYMVDAVEIGFVDGAGLGQGGDAVALYIGQPDPGDLPVDFEAYPDADFNGGQSWDVDLQAFSVDGVNGAVATIDVNDAMQPAVGSPGNAGPVEIVGDIPVITLLGDAEIKLELNDVYEDPGATATDTEDGDITADIVVGGDTVDTATFGIYEVTYDVTDSDGNPAATVTRTVIVTYAQTIPPSPQPVVPNLFTQVATVSGLPGAVVPAYDAASANGYVSGPDGLQIVNLSDPANPQLGALLDPALPPFNLAASEVTSVDTCGGTVAFAVPNDPDTSAGWVVLTDAGGTPSQIVQVGAAPSSVAFTNDCASVLSADQGDADNGVDPLGTISIIEVATGTVRTADFTAFNGQEDGLRALGVRIFPNMLAGNDLEPEFITISPNGSLAYVALQEANSLAVVNIATASVVRLLPLGLKDHSVAPNAIDVSDRDTVINIRNWPLFGMYMPDAVVSYATPAFRSLLITANEGDARDEDERVQGLALDPTAFPPEDDLRNEFNLGRIQVSTIDGDTDDDGDYDQLQAYGARSFSIWDGAGNQLYDSGSDIEAIVASVTPEAYVDGRSDNRGPEPEGVAVGRLGNLQLAFIGLEQTNQVLVYRVNNPANPLFLQILSTPGDEEPEGLTYVSRSDSPNLCPMLLVGNEGSDTLTVYQPSFCAP